MTTNYVNAFITVSPDCKVDRGTAPPRPGSIAALQYEMLSARPYGLTSDDLLFAVEAERKGLKDEDRPAFLAVSRACLRASPLVKQYGFGLHHDERGRVALYGCETDAYRKLSERGDLTVMAGMRSARR